MAIEIDYQNPTTVIAAFICTIIAVTIATMFLSCFRKKKGDKKKKDGKKNAPTAPTPAPATAAPVDTKPSITVENHSNDDDAVVKSKGQEPKNFQENNDVLADFSAVRETEILRSELNNDLFESDKDSTDKPATNVDHDAEQAPEKSKEEDEEGQELEGDDRAKKRGSSQGRSSMLDEINNTLASIQSEASTKTDEIDRSVEEKVDEVNEEITTQVVTTVNAKIEDVKSIDEEVNNKKSDLNSVEKESEDLQKAAATSTSSVMKSNINEVKENLSTELDERLKEKEKEAEEKEVDEKVEGLKSVIDEKSIEVKDEIKSHFQNGVETVKEAGEVKIEEITCKLKEDVESAVTEAIPDLKSDDNPSSPKDDVSEDLTNQHKEEVIVSNSVPELDISPQKEKKIPPKVSPKPSPKIKPKNVVLPADDEITASSLERKLLAPELIKDKLAIHESDLPDSHDEKTVEKVESPPTTPTSPSTKGASRIPMSKKTSGIPKLSFNSSNKSSSASPLSSPDSAVKRGLDQAEEIIQSQKAQKEADSVAAGADLKTNHETPSKPDAETSKPDAETSKPDAEQAEHGPNSPTKETSPLNDENRGSKRKLTKLRYSGRKKSTESKSDESGGSERSSRAGSEAKSDDGKKAGEETEMEKSSRIPVRGGSKPRSSPPKSLGNQ